MTPEPAIPDDRRGALSPPRYFAPFAIGRFTVSAGISKLAAGDRAFDFDSNLTAYLAHKRAVLGSDAHKHYRTQDFPPELEQAVVELMLKRLENEWPGQVRPCETLDAVARQVQEDVVVIRGEGDRDYNAAIHLCSPNGWSPAEKIGLSFFDTHRPVAGIGPLNANAAQWVSLMIGATQGLQRFVWGMRFDDHLDHHPESPSEEWNPAASAPAAWVRVERQVMLGLPTHQAAVFLIRTYLYPVATLPGHDRERLATAIETMPEDIAAYKGLTTARGTLVPWLRSL